MQTYAGAIVQASPLDSPEAWARLVLDTTECCVDVRIMRLEPISERPAKHASRGARRAAFHHVVLAIKKIRRVTEIEGHGREPPKWRELRSRPLPAIPHKIVHAKRACSRGMRAYRRRIPRLEIEISLGRTWSFFAPRIAALSIAIRRSVCGAMKLRFRRQFAPQPFCIRCGFGMTYVYGPFQRQSNLAKHRSVHPEVAFAAPKHRMLHAFLGFPGPGFIAPERTVLVTSGLHKPQKIVIRHVVIVDGEFIHRDFMRAKFVIPAELLVVNAVQPQSRGSRGNFHEVRLDSVRFPR